MNSCPKFNCEVRVVRRLCRQAVTSGFSAILRRVSCSVFRGLSSVSVPLVEINYFRTFRSPNFAEHFRFLSVASLAAPSPFKAPEVAQRIHPILPFFCGRAHLELDPSFEHSRADSLVAASAAQAEAPGGNLLDLSEVTECESSVPFFSSSR